MEEVNGNAAFRLGGERAVLLGRWKPPISGGEFSFGAWVKLKDKLPPGKLVALAGTDHRLNWGFGAWNGKPAAWMPHRGADSIAPMSTYR